MASNYKVWRLFRQKVFAVKARSGKEAIKYGKKFWEDGEFGQGSICMMEVERC